MPSFRMRAKDTQQVVGPLTLALAVIMNLTPPTQHPPYPGRPARVRYSATRWHSHIEPDGQQQQPGGRLDQHQGEAGREDGRGEGGGEDGGGEGG